MVEFSSKKRYILPNIKVFIFNISIKLGENYQEKSEYARNKEKIWVVGDKKRIFFRDITVATKRIIGNKLCLVRAFGKGKGRGYHH